MTDSDFYESSVGLPDPAGQVTEQGNIEHACSYNENAQKCHYLIEQIADFIKQLYEYFFLKKNEIKKLQKNISSDLLASFGMQLTTEDISVTDMHGISDN